jgi:hypothetical protein
MLENRSFDHLFAFRDLPGLPPLDPAAHVNPLDYDNPGIGEAPSPGGEHILAYGPPHSLSRSDGRGVGAAVVRRRWRADLAPASPPSLWSKPTLISRS